MRTFYHYWCKPASEGSNTKDTASPRVEDTALPIFGWEARNAPNFDRNLVGIPLNHFNPCHYHCHTDHLLQDSTLRAEAPHQLLTASRNQPGQKSNLSIFFYDKTCRANRPLASFPLRSCDITHFSCVSRKRKPTNIASFWPKNLFAACKIDKSIHYLVTGFARHCKNPDLRPSLPNLRGKKVTVHHLTASSREDRQPIWPWWALLCETLQEN